MTETQVLLGVVAVLLVAVVVLVRSVLRAKESAAAMAERNATLSGSNMELARKSGELSLVATQAQLEAARLAPYAQVADAELEAHRLLDEARASALGTIADATRQGTEIASRMTRDADRLRNEAVELEARGRNEAGRLLGAARVEADRIITTARAEAKQIAGDALDARDNAKTYERAAEAMKNVIEGYGDRYLIPGRSVLDELADLYGHTDAGAQLKSARERTADLILRSIAADCDYAEENRRKKATEFVIDAFNGRVDSILSRVKYDNFGRLQQQIRDAFALVNANGVAFRNARIEDRFLAARIDELKWAVAAEELRRQDKEEQRLLREQARDEEMRRRELERVQKEADKERLAAERQQRQLEDEIARVKKEIEAKTTLEQKARYEAKLLELSESLQRAHEQILDAEAKNQRAISMAQQTKRGHVYVISNVGSFGDDVYKIGLTRRLKPQDRIDELGDASVPFEFDVHATIESDDAPALERRLHRLFAQRQVNKVNFRREFFRVSLADIRTEIERLGLQKEINWTMTAEAREYKESLAIGADPHRLQEWLRHRLESVPSPVGFESSEPVAAQSNGTI